MNTKKTGSLPRNLFQNRKLIWTLAKNDFRTKYAGSYLGVLWGFIQPVVSILVYWFAFEKGLKMTAQNLSTGGNVPYVLWLTAGLVPWFFLQEAFNGGTSALRDYDYLVKKVVFHVEILPTVRVVSALFTHMFFIAFTLVFFFCYRYTPDIYVIQVVYYSIALMALVLGLCYLTSAIMVFFKDLGQIVTIVLQVGIWITPIMWNIDTAQFSPTVIKILKLNPMFYIVQGYRDALINKRWFWEYGSMTLYYWIFTAVMVLLGVRVFKKLRVHFADVL